MCSAIGFSGLYTCLQIHQTRGTQCSEWEVQTARRLQLSEALNTVKFKVQALPRFTLWAQELCQPLRHTASSTVL